MIFLLSCYETLGEQLYGYCDKYKIPIESIFQILEDQKVVPMIRGKATECNVYIILREMLNPNEWSVVKLNLNAQPNNDDQDISITHKRTGIIIKVECKNAVRGSFKHSKKCKIKTPHCRIKCHKSRSKIKVAATTNDRYSVDAFDIIVSNLSNSIIASGTLSEYFEPIPDNECFELLSEHYNVPNSFEDVFNATFNDWRFAKTPDLAENGFLLRAPPLLLKEDNIWNPINKLEAALIQIVREKRKNVR